jgi:phenylpropionate dioxygenase-like ring-hydroxylating dioxygenase large terminal subunit
MNQRSLTHAKGIQNHSHKHSLPMFEEPIPNRPFAIVFAHTVRHDKPLKIRRFGKDLVLFRDANGSIHCADGICPHRGADLGLGYIQEGMLVCGYHGFHYTGDGSCVGVPCQDPSKPISKAMRLTTHVVREEHGFVWMKLDGSPIQEEIPWLPGMPEPSSTSDDTEVIWNARLSRVAESMLDLHHVGFAHRRYMGAYQGFADYDVKVDDEQIFTHGSAVHVRNPQRKFSAHLNVAFPASFFIGLQTQIRGAVVACPVDDEHTWIAIRYDQTWVRIPWVGRWVSKFVLWSEMRFIQVDDERFASTIRPRSGDLGQGHLVAADRGIAEWYRLRRRVIANNALPVSPGDLVIQRDG